MESCEVLSQVHLLLTFFGDSVDVQDAFEVGAFEVALTVGIFLVGLSRVCETMIMAGKCSAGAERLSEICGCKLVGIGDMMKTCESPNLVSEQALREPVVEVVI